MSYTLIQKRHIYEDQDEYQDLTFFLFVCKFILLYIIMYSVFFLMYTEVCTTKKKLNKCVYFKENVQLKKKLEDVENQTKKLSDVIEEQIFV